jgi:hypothetical protein
LVSGCGTILKTDRLTGGYKLVKRKRTAKGSTPAPASASASASVPKKGGGRPLGSKNKPKTKTMVSAPAKTRKTRKTKKAKVNAFFQAKANAIKSGAKSFVYGGTRYVSAKTKTGMTIFKKAGKNTAMKNALASAPASAPKKGGGRPLGSKNKPKTTTMVSAPAKTKRRVNKTTA